LPQQEEQDDIYQFML